MKFAAISIGLLIAIVVLIVPERHGFGHWKRFTDEGTQGRKLDGIVGRWGLAALLAFILVAAVCRIFGVIILPR